MRFFGRDEELASSLPTMPGRLSCWMKFRGWGATMPTFRDI